MENSSSLGSLILLQNKVPYLMKVNDNIESVTGILIFRGYPSYALVDLGSRAGKIA
jgi:hypothetical protein